jgi:hypothetical protein
MKILEDVLEGDSSNFYELIGKFKLNTDQNTRLNNINDDPRINEANTDIIDSFCSHFILYFVFS